MNERFELLTEKEKQQTILLAEEMNKANDKGIDVRYRKVLVGIVNTLIAGGFLLLTAWGILAILKQMLKLVGVL